MDRGRSQGKRKREEEESTEGASSGQYDVFLSFRGSDTRKAFTDHLYHSLIKAGTVPVCVFKDDNSIPIGEEFGSQILDAITRSKISIPIISENYASSKWCLRELIHIMDCRKRTSHIVLPIFYKVDPSNVRYLKGGFGEAFHSHKKHFDEKDIQEGMQALREVSDLHGWESEKFANRHEGKLIECVVETVINKLQKDFQLDMPDQLVGLDGHTEKIMNWINNPSINARMIGIYGMGGIGKTTLAKCIYNQLSNKFVHVSFLLDVQETTKRHGIVYLQSQLISDILNEKKEVSRIDDGINIIKSRFRQKKVLILLDDIDDKNQLDVLVRKHNWFMVGSLIIVTTRNKAILDQSEFEVDYKYELNELDEVQALLLFNRHAFRMDHSLSEFEGISRDIISTMGGLPLALKVVGSYLYRKMNRKVWEDVWKQLKNQPHRDVQKILQISYDALEDGHKEIFLDIACFLIGKNSKFAMYMWEDCELYPSQGIEELKLRCLIKIGDDGDFMMHDQLRDLGRSIFYQGVTRVQNHPQRLFSHDFLGAAPSKDSMELFSEVRWLQWMVRARDLSLLTINLHLPNLSVLELSSDEITEDWQGWISFMASKQLKVLNHIWCSNLRRTPNLSAFTQLKILILRGCNDLEHLHPSIGKLTSLVSLDLRNCESLKELPEEVGKLKDLEVLLLDDSGITKIPLSICSLRKLEKLSVMRCRSLREIPSSIGDLQNLKHLRLSATRIEMLPSAIGFLRKLEKLRAMSCRSLREIPSSIGDLQNLQHLKLCGAGIEKLPSAIGRLKNLRTLDLYWCCSLKGAIPSEIGDLPSLEILNLNGTPIFDLPESVRNLSSLQSLDLAYCKELQSLPELPSSLQSLNLVECNKLQSLPELPSGLKDLAVTCQSFGLPQLFSLIHLEELCLEVRHLLEDIREPSSKPLKLCFEEWDKLTSLWLEGLTHLKELSIKRCISIKELDLVGLIHLKRLRIEHCDSLFKIETHGNSESLEVIFLYDCNSIKWFYCRNSLHLKKLVAVGCNNLVDIQDLNCAKFLKELNFVGCKSMETLPDLTGCEKLQSLRVRDCKKLTQLPGLEKLNLIDLDISGCVSLEAIPNLSGTCIFRNYEQDLSFDSWSDVS